MALLDNFPTDRLYKFLTIAGLATVLASIVLPVGAMWKLQIQRNQAEGEETESNLKRDALVTEIASLQANGAKYIQQIGEISRRMDRTVGDIRTIATNAKEANPFSTEQMKRLAEIQMKGMKLLTERAKLEQAAEPDPVAIRMKDDELENLLVQLTNGMPDDLTDVVRSMVKAMRLSNEHDRLASAPKPDKSLVEKKEVEARTALEETSKKMDAILQSRRDEETQKRADLLSGMFQGFAQAMVLHTDLLRLQNLVRESGSQMTEKVTEFKIAETKVATKKKELEILSQHNTVAIVGGVAGLLVGLIVFLYGLWWWYRSDRPQRGAVQSLANFLWDAAGRPPGDGVRFWMAAEQGLRDALRTPGT
jgi:hypothetical protein